MKKALNKKIYDFHGGIKLSGEKKLKISDLDNFTEISEFHPEKVYIPLQQHIGAPSQAVVKKGDYVKVGQIIGELKGMISANVHASVSGKVVDIENRLQAGGREAECVVIENDMKNASVESGKSKGIDDLSREEIAKLVEEAGIVGMGGATFPTHVKLSPREKIKTVIFNGAECEPLLMADAALMYYSGERLLRGCQATIKAVGAENGIIGIEKDKEASIANILEIAKNFQEIEIVIVPSRYPQGSTETLVKTLTGEEPPIGVSTRKMGNLIINVSTVVAVMDAIDPGKPLTHRICSVIGDVHKPQNILIPLGTTARDMIEFCGGAEGDISKVIMGGLMMGKTLSTLDASMTKGANGLTVINKEHDIIKEESPCIKCGRCVDVCPINLLPHQLDYYGRKGRADRVISLKIEACINCGCCTYICPAKRTLAETITRVKGEIKEKNKR